MSNHIHLALIAGQDSLASWLRPVHTDYEQWLNERLERIGAVFVRGPNLIHVMPSGVARLTSYLHCNPVRAGVVSDPADSEWTSHRAYLGIGYRPTWLDVDAGLRLAGFSSGQALDSWMKTTETTREDLETFRAIAPRRRGRPSREMGSDPF
jgi:putative transposase